MKLFGILLAGALTFSQAKSEDVCKDAIAKCGPNSVKPAETCGAAPERYIVVLDAGELGVNSKSVLSSHLEWLNKQIKISQRTNPNFVANNLSSKNANRVAREYTIGGFVGYNSIVDLDILAQICLRNDVKYVEVDSKVSIVNNN
ncbi:hypothetical protein AYI70_g1091 [Smittium culicis]|uniref:Inhibitor I9 domain-containing protein n=1 Tax=Smittium culicis TaxID=133412 RepID=A0A1R1YED6_9FUNG|nr:hypothetical protein AYI70_g1091 [Smittium culicis]